LNIIVLQKLHLVIIPLVLKVMEPRFIVVVI